VPGYAKGREHVNAAGVRGPELAPREPGAFRILAMGGSTTWGHKVADDETWPAQLQARLRAAGLPRAEVINGGVSGWGLQQVLIALRTRLLDQLQPDLVLIDCGWNWPVLEGNPEVVRFRRMAATSEHKDWLHRSAFVRWLDRKLEPLGAGGGGGGEGRGGGGTATRAGVTATDAIFTGRSGIAKAMEASFPALYKEAAELSQQRGVPIVIVRYGALAQLPAPADPALAARYEELLRTERTAQVAGEDLNRAARDEYASALAIIDAAAPAAGLRVLDVATRMFQDAGGEGAGARWLDLFRDRMHLTPVGNAAVAEALAALLQEQGLLPAP